MRIATRLTRATAVAVSSAVVSAGCAAPRSQLQDLGSDTYAMTTRSGFFPARSVELTVRAEQDALAQCAARGQALSVLDVRNVDPDPPEISSATVTFRCVAR